MWAIYWTTPKRIPNPVYIVRIFIGRVHQKLTACRLTCIHPFHSSVWSRFKILSGVRLIVKTNATKTSEKKINMKISLEYCFSVLYQTCWKSQSQKYNIIQPNKIACVKNLSNVGCSGQVSVSIAQNENVSFVCGLFSFSSLVPCKNRNTQC